MPPIWAWFGHDEPNYTYTPNGKKLLSELAAASPVPVFMRTHNLLTTGDGTAALKWGSTNAYTEDASGRPIYDWTIIDRIVDTYRERGMKPLFQLGFMPEALSSHPTPYRHFWKPGDNYNDIYTGWSYPPADYGKWGELVFQLVRHLDQKYGRREIESWWFEVWNEPDIGYWHGTPDEYMKLYDFAADGLKRAVPTARIGGPEVTGPNGARTQTILRNFLEHCLRGTNYATGKTGSPLDLVTFHAKGAPQVMPAGFVRMSVSNQLRAIDNGLAVVTSFPELANIPIVLGESDPEGCAACPVRTNPSNAYRNGTMFSSYTAEQIARTYQLADLHRANLIGAVTWAFLFEDQPYFDGFRDLATNGIDKPVVNVFRMLGQMRGDRVRAESSAGLPLADVRDRSVRGAADISALAMRDERSATVLVWNYHDDDVAAPASDVELTIEGLPGRPADAHALPRRPGSQQRVQRVESDGLAAVADAGAIRRAREGRAARAAVAAGSSERRRRPYRRDIHAAASGRLAHQDRLVAASRSYNRPDADRCGHPAWPLRDCRTAWPRGHGRGLPGPGHAPQS